MARNIRLERIPAEHLPIYLGASAAHLRQPQPRCVLRKGNVVGDGGGVKRKALRTDIPDLQLFGQQNQRSNRAIEPHAEFAEQIDRFEIAVLLVAGLENDLVFSHP